MVIYSDIEKTLVSYLKSTLNAMPEYINVRVATVKSKENSLPEVIIKGAYNADINQVLRAASAVIDVYATSYEEANRLSLIVDAFIREATVGDIKKVDVVLGPTRTIEQSQMEKRSLSVDFVVKANNL